MKLVKNFLLIHFVAFLILFFSPKGLFCQPDSNQISKSDASYNEIQFNFINQISVAYKYSFSNEYALRILIDASGYLNNEKRTSLYSYNSEINDIKLTTNKTIFQNRVVTVNLFGMYSIVNKMRYKINAGLGPSFSIGDRSTKFTSWEKIIMSGETRTGYAFYKEFIWSYGIGFSIGFEFQVFNTFYLISEYNFTYNYIRSKSNSQYPPQPNSNSESWNLKLNNVVIGIGFYF
ncbi:MAG: hypothetical protein NTX22_17415 [Ignavibacteriales bacterium]|nr:hypothetical protein [Ignavibacteriales bacterium]